MTPSSSLTHLLTLASILEKHWSLPLTPREGDGAAVDPVSGQLFLKMPGTHTLPWSEEHFRTVDPASFLDLLDDAAAGEREYQDLLEREAADGGPLASTAAAWAYLLSLEEVRFGIHLQPLELCQILCSPRARQFADRRTTPGEVLGTGSAAVLVPYVDPGIEFAREIKRKVVLWRSRFKEVPPILYLHNHGVILLGADVATVFERFEEITRHAKIFVGAAMLGGPVFLTPTNVEKLQRTHGLPVQGFANMGAE